MLRYLPFLLVLALWIYAFIDCLNTPEEEVRKLPKVAWVIIVLLFGEVLIGPVAWLTVGRPRKTVGGQGGGRGPAGGGIAGAFGGRRGGGGGWVAPDDNPEFLKSLRKDDTPRPDPTDAAPESGSDAAKDSGSGKGSGSGSPSGTGTGSASGTGPESGAGERKPEAERRDDDGPEGPRRG
ncbi:PLD nuclease N-terminal domain-containing protein [Streptomyces sp. NPDC057702]|uniref:PLD nuclease N-terminal domain-containing protein n=1 Tax=unclassified Streptomyces TaxID=2593676 RepID=UPI0036A30BD3